MLSGPVLSHYKNAYPILYYSPTHRLRIERLEQTQDLKGRLQIFQITLVGYVQDTARTQGDIAILCLHHDEFNHLLLDVQRLLVPVHIPQDHNYV